MYKAIATLAVLVSMVGYGVTTAKCQKNLKVNIQGLNIMSKADLKKHLSLADIEEGHFEKVRSIIDDRKLFQTDVVLYKKKNGRCFYNTDKREKGPYAVLWSYFSYKDPTKKINKLRVHFPLSETDKGKIGKDVFYNPNFAFEIELDSYESEMKETYASNEVFLTENEGFDRVDTLLGEFNKLKLTISE